MARDSGEVVRSPFWNLASGPGMLIRGLTETRGNALQQNWRLDYAGRRDFRLHRPRDLNVFPATILARVFRRGVGRLSGLWVSRSVGRGRVGRSRRSNGLPEDPTGRWPRNARRRPRDLSVVGIRCGQRQRDRQRQFRIYDSLGSGFIGGSLAVWRHRGCPVDTLQGGFKMRILPSFFRSSRGFGKRAHVWRRRLEKRRQARLNDRRCSQMADYEIGQKIAHVPINAR